MSTTLYYRNKYPRLVWIVPPKIQRAWKSFGVIQALKEANKTNDKYSAQGWILGMASSDFNGLIRLYGEEVLEKIKGCEFHFMNSASKHSRNHTEKTDVFKSLAKELLIVSTEGAYLSAYEDMKAFISSDENLKHLLTWLSWWHDRKFNIFRAYTGYLKPRSNQSEVIHASWVNLIRKIPLS